MCTHYTITYTAGAVHITPSHTQHVRVHITPSHTQHVRVHITPSHTQHVRVHISNYITLLYTHQKKVSKQVCSKHLFEAISGLGVSHWEQVAPGNQLVPQVTAHGRGSVRLSPSLLTRKLKKPGLPECGGPQCGPVDPRDWHEAGIEIQPAYILIPAWK